MVNLSYPLVLLKLGEVAVFFFAGFLLESALETSKKRETPVYRGSVYFNCFYTVFFIVPEMIAGAWLSLYLSELISVWRWNAPISLSFSDHGVFTFAILIAFGWALIRDFFHYWIHRL